MEIRGVYFRELHVEVLTQADKLILIRILSLEHFGYYMLAWSVASSLWAIICRSTPLFPQFVQLFERREELTSKPVPPRIW
jgi:O-antigen/teichoic acid export membrane protein